MAGSFGPKLDPKSKIFAKNNNGEILKDYSVSSADQKPNGLFGTLFPGQSIELNKKETTTNISWNREFLIKTTSQEQNILVKNENQDIEKAINELRLEIKNLIQTTENLDQEVKQTIELNIPEINQYQLNFLQRIKKIIVNFRININQAEIWLESFNTKKSKRNAYWNNFKNKHGGTQSLNSNEHAVAHSTN